jgi:hypothetical protein
LRVDIIANKTDQEALGKVEDGDDDGDESTS